MTPEAFALALHGWQNFYTLLGEASATLTGLMFVAASLGARLISDEDDPKVRTFLTPTVVHFSLVLLLSALMNVPAPSPRALAFEVAAVGLALSAYSLSHLARLRDLDRDLGLPRAVWVWTFALPLAASLGLALSALALARRGAGALEIAGAATILLVMVGLRNAWNTTLQLARQTPSD